METFEEYVLEKAFDKCSLYYDLTGREPSKEELLEFLRSEYDYDYHQQIPSNAS